MMDDLISRQAVLDMAYAYGNGWEPEGYCVNVEDIQALPSAQRWIPVSERLPEDSEYHLVTEYHMVSFARYWEHRWWDAFGDKAKFVTAWMPLPEPYKEENRNDER